MTGVFFVSHYIRPYGDADTYIESITIAGLWRSLLSCFAVDLYRDCLFNVFLVVHFLYYEKYSVLHKCLNKKDDIFSLMHPMTVVFLVLPCGIERKALREMPTGGVITIVTITQQPPWCSEIFKSCF